MVEFIKSSYSDTKGGLFFKAHPVVAKTPAAATAATAAQTPPPPPSPKTPLKPDETFSSSIPDVAPPMTPADNDYRYTVVFI